MERSQVFGLFVIRSQAAFDVQVSMMQDELMNGMTADLYRARATLQPLLPVPDDLHG